MQRELLLPPNPVTLQIVAFCLAWVANNTGVLLHTICVLGNHYHAVVTDPRGELPYFMQELNKYISKCMNTCLGRWENFWAAEQPCSVRLLDDADVLDKMVYTLANPVSSRLLQRGDMWPGLRLGPEAWGQDIEIQRPEVFFRKDGKVPQKQTLQLCRPAIFDDLSDAELAGLLHGEVEAREAQHRQDAKREGKRFLGLRAILQEATGRRPRSRAPRRTLRPRVAGKDRWRRLEALRRLKDFQVAYREAYEAWRAGNRDVVFPAGTYALRVHAGVTCAPFP